LAYQHLARRIGGVESQTDQSSVEPDSST